MAYSSTNSQHLVWTDESSSSLTGMHQACSSTYRPGKVHTTASWHDTQSLRYTKADRYLHDVCWGYIPLKNEWLPFYSNALSLPCHSPTPQIYLLLLMTPFFQFVSLCDRQYFLSLFSWLGVCLALFAAHYLHYLFAGHRYKNLPIISSIIPLQNKPFCCHI